MEFFGLGSYLAFLYFFPVSRGFFVGVFPGLQVSLVDTHPKNALIFLDVIRVMYSLQFCLLGSVGLQ